MAQTNTRSNQGTGFVNYNDILNANQNSGQQLGQTVGQGLESQAGAVNSNLAGQQSQFDTGLQNANTDYSNVSALANQLATNSTQDLSSNDYSNLSNIDPNTAAQNGQALQAYNYNGPTGLKDTSGLQSQAQSASQVGQLAGTSQGQQELLKQYVGGNNNYTSGMGSFDQALLNKYGQGDINQAKQSLSNIDTNVNNAINNADTQANAAQNFVNSDKTNLINTITNNLSGGASTPGILGNAAQNEINYTNNGASLQSILSSPAFLSQGTAGLTPDQLTTLQSLAPNISQYGIDTNQMYDMGTAANDQATQNQAISALVSQISNSPGGYRFSDPNQLSAANLLNSFIGNGQTPINNNTSTYFAPDANQSVVNKINSNDYQATNAATQDIATTKDINNTLNNITQGAYPTAPVNEITNNLQSYSPQALQAIFGTSDPTQILANSGISTNNTSGVVNTSVNTPAEQSATQKYIDAANAYQQGLQNNINGGQNSVQNWFNNLISSKNPFGKDPNGGGPTGTGGPMQRSS